eukprot:1779322-Pleurochrysis_carterae.AAC.1
MVFREGLNFLLPPSHTVRTRGGRPVGRAHEPWADASALLSPCVARAQSGPVPCRQEAVSVARD